MTVILIPFKDLRISKSRLSEVLSSHKREKLSLSMLEDVLAASTSVPGTKTILVSQDQKAAGLASRYGANIFNNSAEVSKGINCALNAACDELALSYAGDVLILHSDLPLIKSSDIQALLEHRKTSKAQFIIGPDENELGTNALLFSMAHRPDFQYGHNSFKLHKTGFRKSGKSVETYESPNFAFDVDTPDDLLDMQTLHDQDQLSPHTCSALDAGLLDELIQKEISSIIKASQSGTLPMDKQALMLARASNMEELTLASQKLRDKGFGNVITYSRKVFIPLTKLCRDVCHYCTFATTPKNVSNPFMLADEVIEICKTAKARGCKEALFTLGEKPELRYAAAREALAEMGFKTTIDYLAHVAERVVKETGLLPHINAGNMTLSECEKLKEVSASMGIMLESSSNRLCQKGMPHYGSPDKVPATRLETIDIAGRCHVPLTTGILIGIGETRPERIQSLLDIRKSHKIHGHIQEIIIQNFRAKPSTLMSNAPEPDLEELRWTIAIARIIFGSEMSIQVPPNLNREHISELIDAGVNDWGGVSPLTPDFVNPEAPWPEIEDLSEKTLHGGKILQERLTIYPEYAQNPETWLHHSMMFPVWNMMDATGLARMEAWEPGQLFEPPKADLNYLKTPTNIHNVSPDIIDILAASDAGTDLSLGQITRLLEARGPDFGYICQKADQLRQKVNGDTVTYVVNRNINYTNICTFKCQFCAFSKGKRSENLGGKPYDLSGEEVRRRTREAWERGATEVCMQGGIHPSYTGQTYIEILDNVKSAAPDIHIHAFSPLEIWQGAQSIGLSVADFLQTLKDHGLGTLPGTAAEILEDEIRDVICPDKIDSSTWLDIIETAHKLGIKTTATMMFGHIDSPRHWASHMIKIRDLQKRTNGITEFVPLPFVASEAPIYRKKRSRRGPTFRETILVHAVARIVFHGLIDNIQGSWVKLGLEGLKASLIAGVNDVGGTLMNESITKAAGAKHGQEWGANSLEQMVIDMGRLPNQRSTYYKDVPLEHQAKSRNPSALSAIVNTPPFKQVS